ncbi:hypothetical protein [Marinicella rhabdoformis]|uniref:hypothetical protein n=1 Tax=Marinicella rhabdoformis TaxID=2580566 RepID=UPI0012AED72A|nr:hypothetical protein [Marinicella rhabdoformis]
MNKQHIDPMKAKVRKKFTMYMMLFAMMLQFTYHVGNTLGTNPYLKVLFALLPVVPFIFALISFAAMIKQDDEMFKKITSDAFILTGCITLVWTMAVGLFQRLNLLPHFSVYTVFFIMVFTFAFCYTWIYKKYR